MDLSVPQSWDEVGPEWMTAALAGSFPGVEVSSVDVALRDDGTNRRARLALSYARGSGPATVFLKASDLEHAAVNARTGGVFNEPRLFASDVPLPLDHPTVHFTLIDEPRLDFIMVMEDIRARGCDPRDATRPMTVEQVANGVRSLARFHSAFWGDRMQRYPQLSWVQPFTAWRGMATGIDIGLERAGDRIPAEIRALTGKEIMRDVWVPFVGTLATGGQTLPSTSMSGPRSPSCRVRSAAGCRRIRVTPICLSVRMGLVVPSVEEVRGMDPAALEAALRDLDVVRREAESATALLLAHAEQARAFKGDGHRTPRALGMAACNWSYADAGLLVQCAHVLQVLPSAYGLGVSQLHALAGLVANPRVRHALADAEALLVGKAQALEFHVFAGWLGEWERTVDPDGSESSLDRADRDRDAKVRVVGDATYVDAKAGNTQGAQVKEIFDAFCEAEFLADWEQGVAQHGEAMHRNLLARTDSQRRFDAFHAVFLAAAKALGKGDGSGPVVNIVWDAESFEHELQRAAGGTPGPLDPTVPHFCRTDTGAHIDPRDALIAALVGQMRRVVVDSAGVIVDLGRKQRLFTGAVRDAILALQVACMWTGCRQRPREVDHLIPWARGGLTDAANAGGACGHHNRWRARGYGTTRGADGEFHHYRPDGTEIGWRAGGVTRLVASVAA
jgi:hypothetical protein